MTKWSNKPGSCTIDKILYQQQDRVEKHPDLPTLLSPASRLLSTADFLRLCEVPAETAWFANIDNLQTRRDYQNMLEDFMKFTGIKRPDEFREISPAWRVIGLILAAPSFGPSATTAQVPCIRHYSRYEIIWRITHNRTSRSRQRCSGIAGWVWFALAG